MIPSEGWDTGLIKYIKSKISIKIFLLTMVVLMGIAGISYGFVAALMPRTYSDSLNRTLAAKAKQLAESLKDYTLENAETLMGEFSDANQSRVVLLDEKGEILREWNSYGGSTSWEGDFAILEDTVSGAAEDTEMPAEGTVDGTESTEAGTAEMSTETTDAIESAEVGIARDAEMTTEETTDTVYSTEELMEQLAMGHYPVSFKDSEKSYTLFVFGSTRLVNQAVEALGKIMPWLFLSCFFISVILSFFYSRYLSRPVRALSQASGKMADFDFSVRTAMKRTDELGILSENLDCMAGNLDQALKSLQQANSQLKSEMEQEREQEQRRMEFFAAASHELKTPITILKGQIEGMAQNVGVYKDRDCYLARAGEVTVTLQGMVQEILTISKMESAGFQVKKKEINLAELIWVQIAELNDLLEEKEMALTLSLPETCKCMADPGLMETVIRNLLVNALRYSPAGEEIRVELLKKEQEKELVFTIENTGVHIPEQDFGRIFDAFYRMDSSRNRKNGGSGLGLYIVREILEQHGAWYEMKNTKKGVLFQFKIGNDACNRK